MPRYIAVAVMPEHLHAIWRLPEDDSDPAVRRQQIKKAFSVGLAAAATRSGSIVAKREKGIWQRRYWEHQIRDEADLVAHIEYIHFNPVKHRHVGQVKDWPYSSFHRWVRNGMLPASWGLASTPAGVLGER